MNKWGHARIVLLVRNDLEVHVMRDIMEEDTATIWARIGTTKSSYIAVGGIYRQHQILGDGNRDLSWQESLRRQEQRWKSVVKKWREISSRMKCVTIGDINLDYNKWPNPEVHHENMINEVKDNIEVTGSVQLIREITRTMCHQVDSLLDQIWSNCDQKNHQCLQ